MKNKTKLMLALSILTAGTLAAGATGTFAWFTTNKTATANYTKIVAQGTQGSLKASISGVTETISSEESNATEVEAKSSKMSDVSSNNGMDFVQPDWVDKAGNKQKVHGLLTVSKKSGYFTQYTVTVKNDGSDGSIVDIYLAGVSITSTDSNQTANWTRIAIITGVDGDNSGYLAPRQGETAKSYLFQNSITENATDQYVSGVTESDLTLTKCDNLTVSSDAYDSTKFVLGTKITKGNSIKVGVSVWIEGTMQDDQDNATKSGVSTSIKLSFASITNE